MLLNEDCIRQQLKELKVQPSVGLHILSTIDSTNRYLKDISWTYPLELCCAEEQTQGRGRFQRAWSSPNKGNLYCSLGLSIPQSISNVSALSLIVGIAIKQSLEQMDIKADIRLKWPNDLLWQGKKLCGVLIESISFQKELRIIIGIGLNVNIDPKEKKAMNLPNNSWCSLYEMTGQIFDRNRLLALLLRQINNDINQFTQHGLQPFLDRWQKWDYLQGKKIIVTQSNECIQGMAQGINAFGQLIVIDDTQKIHYIASGEASIQSA
ncbi:MAG TPA: biotin--[acetyl-CoA-carboxylase] ligase [Legionellaceae bacterium]|nr:biotin--[acetyl-CoA-carboxylase] ligase [Legionellaceae bacterium]